MNSLINKQRIAVIRSPTQSQTFTLIPGNASIFWGLNFVYTEPVQAQLTVFYWVNRVCFLVVFDINRNFSAFVLTEMLHNSAYSVLTITIRQRQCNTQCSSSFNEFKRKLLFHYCPCVVFLLQWSTLTWPRGCKTISSHERDNLSAQLQWRNPKLHIRGS